MDVARITPAGEGLTFTTTPTDEMTFLCLGDETMPDVMVERLAPGDGPPLHSHPWAAWDVVSRGRVRFQIDGETYDTAGPGAPIDIMRSVESLVVSLSSTNRPE